MTTPRIELFCLGDATEPAGVLATSIDDGTYRCHIAFESPGGDVETEVIIATSGSIRDWSSFVYRGSEGTLTGTRDADGVRVADRTLASADDVVVPSYGVSALVGELVSGSESEAAFGWLDESAGANAVVTPARLRRSGSADVVSPVAGKLSGCEQITLTVGDRRTNTYWVLDGEIVATDWAGARSYPLPGGVAARLVRLASPSQHHPADSGLR